MKLIVCFLVVSAIVLCQAQGQSSTSSTTTVAPEIPTTLGNETEIGPIIHMGERVAPGEIPYHAYLLEYRSNGQNFICGGSLIRPTWILTAAHCIASDPSSRTEVYMGSTNIRNMPYREFAVERIAHPGYQSNPTINDVAVLRLPVAASGQNIAVVRMASRNTGSLVDVPVQVSGFGSTGTNRGNSRDLLKADLIVISNEECRETFGSVRSSNICARWHEKYLQSPCPGDSGGELTAELPSGERMVVGTVSYGRGPGSGGCDTGLPVAFARISSYRTWIDSTVNA